MVEAGRGAKGSAAPPTAAATLVLCVLVLVVVAGAWYWVTQLGSPIPSDASQPVYLGVTCGAAALVFAGIFQVSVRHKWTLLPSALLFGVSAILEVLGYVRPVGSPGTLYQWSLILLLAGCVSIVPATVWHMYRVGLLLPRKWMNKPEDAVKRHHLIQVGYFPGWKPSSGTAIKVGEYIRCEISIVNSGPDVSFRPPLLDGYPHLGLTFAATGHLRDLATGADLDPHENIPVPSGGARLIEVTHQAIKVTHGIMLWYRLKRAREGTTYSSPGFPIVVNPDDKGNKRLDSLGKGSAEP